MPDHAIISDESISADLRNPSLGWVDLARGMGVEAIQVDTCRSFSAAFKAAMNGKGPFLIEAVV